MGRGDHTEYAAQIAEIRETIEELSRHDERQVRARGAENLQRRCLLLHKSISGVSVESSDTASTGEAGDVGVDHLHLTTGYGNVLEEILDHLHSKRAMLHDEVLAMVGGSQAPPRAQSYADDGHVAHVTRETAALPIARASALRSFPSVG